jgi:HlyD family secretion protein
LFDSGDFLKRVLIALVLVAVAAVAFWAFRRQSDAPSVPFAKAVREKISNTLSTNGKVEPVDYVDVRVDTSGLLQRLLVHQGDSVRAGQLLAELSQPGVAEELATAEARAAQSRAELGTLRAGGRSAELAELDGSTARLKSQKDAAQRNLASLERLVQANAATKYEADQARQVVADLDAQLNSLGQRKFSLVGKGDLAAAEARVREAETAIQLARVHTRQNSVVAPMAGIVYSLPARPGMYMNAGDAVASVGKLDPVRVRVYVDEPELGRVAAGQPVRITWDALPGKEWNGTVAKRPTEVIALGTRQVGEVLCAVENPLRELIPGTNVNAFILTQVVQNALTIPKASVRRDSGVGVYVLENLTNTVRWQMVTTGASDALRVEIISGLKEGDLVAQSTDVPLKGGAKVVAIIQ